jgi:CRISPR-associated exonuclease Cas4
MTFDEDDLLPVSALQHLAFCVRQCALIHIERVWADNPLTLEGSHMHERVDETGARRETRGDLMVARGLALRSLRLGLSGRADVVEFHRVGRAVPSEERLSGVAAAVPLSAATGTWVPFPVDYKHGKPKLDRCDEVQLCAQALCLEEMLLVGVPRGALFYGKTQRRYDVTFDTELRKLTETTAARLHELIASGVTPKAVREPRCEHCSLLSHCLPEAMSPRRSASRYLKTAVAESLAEKGGGD